MTPLKTKFRGLHYTSTLSILSPATINFKGLLKSVLPDYKSYLIIPWPQEKKIIVASMGIWALPYYYKVLWELNSFTIVMDLVWSKPNQILEKY